MAMAIVVEHELGWILDEQCLYNACYESLRYRISAALYEIEEPFRMDSQVEAMNKRKETNSIQDKAAARKRRNRKRSAEPIEIPEDEFYSTIKRDFDILVEFGRSCGYFNFAVQDNVQLTNNRKAKDAAKQAESLSKFGEIDMQRIQPGGEAETLHLQPGQTYDVDSLVNRTCVNDFSQPIIIQLRHSGNGIHDYVVPAGCKVAWGDVGEQMKRLLHGGMARMFDMVILDPPWHNKSVKRQKTYFTSDETYLEDLPISELLQSIGLVAIWITNNPRYYDFVIDVLLPRWGLVLEAKWTWFKVTKSGEPVCHYRKGFKAPFEIVMIARNRKSHSNFSERSLERKLIISVPSALPSRKPPLFDIMKRYFQKDTLSCLELYARYLVPDTFSIGNEVLKFQCHTYFEKIHI